MTGLNTKVFKTLMDFLFNNCDQQLFEIPVLSLSKVRLGIAQKEGYGGRYNFPQSRVGVIDQSKR